MDVFDDHVHENAYTGDGIVGGGEGNIPSKLAYEGGGEGDVCDLVEREGAWMPDKPLKVPNAPEADTWSSSESEDSESESELEL
jgi:hypothetical protein